MIRVRVAVIAAFGCLVGAGGAQAAPIVFPTVTKEYQLQQASLARASAAGITPPAPPCPENGLLYPPPVPPPGGVPYLIGNCGVSQPAATSMPWMGNMAYYGGHVEVHPKIYLVYWGWGANGAFPGQTCSPVALTQVTPNVTLPCDPDGAGRYMAEFVKEMGATAWANVSTQYYQTDAAGNQTFIANDPNVLAGIWVDDANSPAAMPGSSSSNPVGSTNTYTLLAQEASRAAKYFNVTGAALADANFVVIQPPGYSDPNAIASGYCAFHDFTEPGVPGNFYYNDPGVQKDIAYTNMPYSLAINSSGVNVCGENAVNSGAAGKLDGFSIVLGHELEETITDPGAESVVGNITTGSQTYYGGWYDTTDPNENGDKCAWVGENVLTGQGPPEPIYGALGDITGNAGTTFAVQSLWSNAANEGTGYCAGAGTDSPIPSAPYGSSSSNPSSGGGGSSSSGGPTSGGTSGSGSSSSGSGAGTVQAHTTTHTTTKKSHRRRRRRRRRPR